MSFVFCLDFGNSKKKIAVLKNKKILEVVCLKGDETHIIQKLLKTYKPTHSILSSVILHDKKIESLLKEQTEFLFLSHLTKLPFSLSFTKTETMGADRLALIAACHNQQNKNCLVISLGTCITYNFINTQKMFLGGSISPGVQMRFKAMNNYTALLPLVEATIDFPLIGYDTKTNLISGVMLGIEKEIDGIINEYKKQYKKFYCVLTGGNANFFAKRLKNKIFADDFFLFKGLYEILQFQKN